MADLGQVDLDQLLANLREASQVRLLLVSDSHGRTDGISGLLQQTDLPDLIVHLGDHQDSIDEIAYEMDCPVLGVAGNCDHWQPSGDLPEQRLVVIAGRRFFLAHGHRFHVKSGWEQLLHVAVNPPYAADFIVFGHTHHRLIHRSIIDGRTVWLLNPGSAYPGRGGPQGIWLEISGDEIRIDPLPDL